MSTHKLFLSVASSLALALFVCGCEQDEPMSRAAASAGSAVKAATYEIMTSQEASASKAAAPEEFEGVVELFGQRLKARRQVKLDAVGNYVNHGQAVAWYESGQKAGTMQFREGVPNGAQKVWHPSGRKKLHGQWEDGVAIGQWTEWHDTGHKMSEGVYVSGQKHGTWRFWNDAGRLDELVEYDHGQEVPVAGRPRTGAVR